MTNKGFIALVFAFILALFSSYNSLADTKIKTHSVQYMSGRDTVEAYLATPEGDGPFPALIVIHEWWGLTDWVKQNADEFARRGYVALAIDLYRGRVATSPEEAHEIMRGLPEDRAAKDLKSAFSYLNDLSIVSRQRIGSIGWCMGGGYSLAAALNIKKLAASVVCYGRIVTEDDEIKKISCPILGIYGEKDRGIPEASVVSFERRAQQLDKDVRVTVFPGVGHAFMNPTNTEGYNKKTADEAWKKIYAFLHSKLMAKN